MSRSKNVYQGMNVQRIHRSELDDNKLRDLAREEVRLCENLKTVERARTVMLKSIDADKQLFIKSGSTQSGNKVNKSNTYGSTQKLTSSQSARSVPDQKVKRAGSSEQNDPPSNEPGSGHGADRPRDQTDGGGVVIVPLYDTGSVYDQLFEANAIHAPAKRSSKAGLSIVNIADVQTVARNDAHGARPEDAGLSRTQGEGGKNNDTKGSNSDHELSRDHSSDVKRPSIWETLSTPKHVSMTKAKRTQVEREFLRPAKSSTAKAKTDQQKRTPVIKKTAGQAVIRKS